MDPLEALVGTTLGPFKLLRLLGRGSQGAVFLSRDEVLARDLAIKVLLPSLVLGPLRTEFIDNFRDEARILSSLHHTNIVPVYRFDIQGNIAYLVMHYAPGGSLKDRMDKSEHLTVEEISAYLTQAAAALDYAHQRARPIIHRDVKPHNFLLEDETLMLADFGIAELMMSSSEITGDPTLASTGFAIRGTPAYLAPEVARGERADGRADIYSLGIMLYQMLTGHVPFNHQAGVWWTMMQHIQDPLPSITKEIAYILPDYTLLTRVKPSLLSAGLHAG